MKKLILCASVYLAMVCSYKLVTANDAPNFTADSEKETAISNNTAMNNIGSIEDHIKAVYNEIDFSSHKKLDYEVFEKAYYGYLNLRSAGKVTSDKNILSVCDFSKSSTAYRLWVIDLNQKKVLINDYVAHGQGSGDEFATVFSNTENSHQSSLGFYVTSDTYIGKHGNSLRLVGLDRGFNSAAYDRAVVIHGADYVCPEFVAGQKRLGRSWGCPAVSNKIADKLINTIKNGTCVFVYAPQKQYLSASVWLNKPIDKLPADAFFKTAKADIAMKQPTLKVQRDTVIVYEKDFLQGTY